MKKIRILCGIGAALVGVSLFMVAGCSNLVENEGKESASQAQTHKGRILISVDSVSRAVSAASTVNPSGFNFEKDSGLTFTLTGTFEGVSSTLGSWNDTDDTKAYSLMLHSYFLVDTGDWSFRLSVTKDGSEVLYGTKNLTVKFGSNPLDFGTLSEVSGENVVGGNVSFTLTFPLDAAKGANATLTAVEAETAGEETPLEVTSTTEKSSVTFTKSADVGTYILAVKLYSSEETKNDSTYLNTYTALVNVAPGQASEGSVELSDLNALYTITYNLNGGSFADGVATSLTCNNHVTVTLPAPTRTGYTFAGWSKTEVVGPVETPTTTDYKAGEEITLSCDTTLYALWTAVTYTITYNMNDSSAENGNDAVTSFTVEEETFSLPTPTTTTEGVVFVGWYTTDSFDDGTDLVQIEKGTAENITLYAKWLSITEQIKSMTESGTIKAGGKFSIDLIEKINTALKELVATDGRSDVLVTLDLSEVTGLTALDSFDGCKNLAGIILPDSVTSIESAAFSGCTSLESIVIPDNVTTIGGSAFSGCTSLKNITIPSGVTSIGSSAFFDCSNLESIAIPSGVTSIGACTFYGCASLASITIPSGVTIINDYTFNGCTSLESVAIPDGVTTIRIGAFSGCTSLATITIPKGVKTIYGWAFKECTSLSSATFANTSSTWYYGLTVGMTNTKDGNYTWKITSTIISMPEAMAGMLVSKNQYNFYIVD